MITLQTDINKFQSELNNIVSYSEGFFEGVQRGKARFAENLAKEVIEALKEFIDSNARVSPETLHHVYEWYQSGSPDARLFDIQHTSNSTGISFNSSFRQSSSVQQGSNVPFYNKAEIMEKGIAVRIKPVRANALAFEEGGQTVFTKGPVTVINPGGSQTTNAYENVFNQFFSSYFSQSFIISSGIMSRVSRVPEFISGFSQAARTGKAAGVQDGIRMMSKDGSDG
jgi:hypothetical protein